MCTSAIMQIIGNFLSVFEIKYWILCESCDILVRYSALGEVCALTVFECLFFVNSIWVLDRVAGMTL